MTDREKLEEGKRRIIRIINTSLTDDKHRQWTSILETGELLKKLCTNVRDFSDDEKYRHVRSSNPKFQQGIASVPGAEDLLLSSGWRIKVVEYERSIVFQKRQGSVEWQLLEYACTELEKLVTLATSKLNRSNKDDKKAEEKRRLEAVRMAIQEDREQRQIKAALALERHYQMHITNEEEDAKHVEI